MTRAERQQLHKAMSRAQERREIREAITASAVQTSIDRLLGDELIAAARETIQAWYARQNSQERLFRAVRRLEDLVGKP